MLRSKQQAIMFLLGAVLVGGVMGYSTQRVVENYQQKQDQERRIDRPSFFDDLGLTPEQRAKWEAITDTTNCRVLLISAPYKPAMDSLRDRSWAQLQAALTPEQLKKMKDRAKTDSLNRVARLASRGRDGGALGGGPGGPGGGRGDPGFGRGNSRAPARVTQEYCNTLLKEQPKQ